MLVFSPLFVVLDAQLMVTSTNRPTNRQPGEYRAICLWKMEWQSFAILRHVLTPPPQASLHPPQDPQEAQDELTADKKGLV